MMNRLKAAGLAMAFAVASTGTMAAVSGASAATLPLTPAPLALNDGTSVLPVEKVGERRARHRRRSFRRGYRRGYRRSGYDHRRHGRRYSYRRGRHRHYHNGYWYAVPFWLGTAAILNSYNQPYYNPGYAAPRPVYRRARGNRHVRWCLNRYRSYSPRTDQFLSYSGHYKYCRSPFRR